MVVVNVLTVCIPGGGLLSVLIGILLPILAIGLLVFFFLSIYIGSSYLQVQYIHAWLCYTEILVCLEELCLWINIINIFLSVFIAVKDVILYTHCVRINLNTTMNTYCTVTLLWFMLSFILPAGWVRRWDAEQDRPAQHQECDPEVEPGAPAWRGHHQAGPTSQGQHCNAR